jgi:murein DD-endopeptidase MepM/ murein hydrolase activator NlpD
MPQQHHHLSPILIPTLMLGLLTYPISAIAQVDSVCPKPALDRIINHTVAGGETLDGIAERYSLIPATIMGLNPAARSGGVSPGQVLQIPPYNGIRVDVPSGMLLRDLAKKYKVRADVLFEVNGCQPSPRVAFIPGVNWSPSEASRSPQPVVIRLTTSYPLPQSTTTLLGYGWKLKGEGEVGLHTGVDLAAGVGTSVLAAADGTVAYAGNQGTYGNVIVINHAQGYQTRYAQLEKLKVKVGDLVTRGEGIATVGQSGRPSSPEAHLHFELRSNSKLGWVAEDPQSFLK